jgi:drug/metabolite transporter (DMT)-like permease
VKYQAVNRLSSFRFLSFVVIIWGANGLAIKNVLQSSPPLFFTGICLLGGAIAIGIVRLCTGYPRQRGCEGKGRAGASRWVSFKRPEPSGWAWSACNI